MNVRAFSHLGNQALERRLEEELARDCERTATLLALVAEVDLRRLYLPAGFPSLYTYCVHKLGMPEDVALRRIRAARAARRFPAIIDAVAEGRLHLTGLAMLARHLTAENGAGLLAAAERKTKAQIKQLLAARFPSTELMEWVLPISPPSSPGAPPALDPGSDPESVKELPKSLAPARVALAAPRAEVAPIAPQRFALQVMLGERAHEKMRYAQALLGHAVPSGELAAVLEHAFDALIEKLEKRKYAATSRPRAGHGRRSANPRHIPAHVKRAVCERDGRQCTFVSDSGRRCAERSRLEFDHIEPVARGGEATVANIRLRCAAHNLYEAECAFGAGFMEEKRRAATEARSAARARGAAATREAETLEEDRATAEEQAKERDVVPWLLKLGVRASDARRAAEVCERIPDASLEERVKLALSYLVPPCRVSRPATATASWPRGHWGQ